MTANNSGVLLTLRYRLDWPDLSSVLAALIDISSIGVRGNRKRQGNFNGHVGIMTGAACICSRRHVVVA